MSDELYEFVAINEMANLRQTVTGLTGVVWCRSKTASHGCRIKYYPNISKKDEVLIVTVPNGEIVEDKLPKSISNYDKKAVIVFALKNSEHFLYFWDHGEDMFTDEIDQFTKNIRPITDAEREHIKKLRIKK